MTIKKTANQNNGTPESHLESVANGTTHRSDKPDPEDVPGTPQWYEELYRLEAEAGGALAAPRWVAKRLAQGERGRLYVAARNELCDAFRRTTGNKSLGPWRPPFDAYCDTVEDNLLDGVPFGKLRQAFDDGEGKELHGDQHCPPKMAAVYSSSALVVNTFGPYYDTPGQLVINGHTGFHRMDFEAQLSHGLERPWPHLDLCLESDTEVLAIESKCLEYLTAKRAFFKPAYDSIADTRAESAWFKHIAVLREDSAHYKYLDAAQLIKHYLGLSYSRPKKSITLLYLFWEPVNWKDFETFRDHRKEIANFADVVSGGPVRFEAMSYIELWKEWEQRQAPSWLAGHLERLMARYSVDLVA
jgi:restriction endonuclease-like protein